MKYLRIDDSTKKAQIIAGEIINFIFGIDYYIDGEINASPKKGYLTIETDLAQYDFDISLIHIFTTKLSDDEMKIIMIHVYHLINALKIKSHYRFMHGKISPYVFLKLFQNNIKFKFANFTGIQTRSDHLTSNAVSRAKDKRCEIKVEFYNITNIHAYVIFAKMHEFYETQKEYLTYEERCDRNFVNYSLASINTIIVDDIKLFNLTSRITARLLDYDLSIYKHWINHTDSPSILKYCIKHGYMVNFIKRGELARLINSTWYQLRWEEIKHAYDNCTECTGCGVLLYDWIYLVNKKLYCIFCIINEREFAGYKIFRILYPRSYRDIIMSLNMSDTYKKILCDMAFGITRRNNTLVINTSGLILIENMNSIVGLQIDQPFALITTNEKYRH